MSGVRLGAGAEFDIIRSMLEGANVGPGAEGWITTGPGDDAVVLEGGLVLSTDLAVEDVHFRRTWLSTREIGYRAAAAALSDLAAMAAEPIGVLVSLAVPADVEGGVEEVAPALTSGIREVVEGLGGALLGGDLSRSPGPIVLDVVAVGRAQDPALRSGAAPGDAVWVTGVLGAAAGAVEAWGAGEAPAPALREAFARPAPRIREALWLREKAVVHALIDVSDGIAGDVGHLATASGVRVFLAEAAVPIHAGLPDGTRAAPADGAARSDGPAPTARADSRSSPLRHALFGGEDYELLFTAARGSVEPLAGAFRERFGIRLTRVGVVESGEGVRLRHRDGSETALERGAFGHFDPERR